MDKNILAAYLTVEFTQHYPPNRYLSTPGNEIKLWLCPTLGMPIFSNAEYGGPSTPTPLPAIAKPTIHIRTLHIDASEFNNSDPDVADRIQQRMLIFIFEKIRQQIDLIFEEAKVSKSLKTSIESNKDKVNAILGIVKNHLGKQHAKPIIH